MSFINIIVEKRHGIAKVTLNRPQVLNALNQDTVSEMEAAINDIEQDKDVKVLVITGAGRAFCAGADLKFVEQFQTGARPDILGQDRFSQSLNRLFNTIENLSKPSIAAINGICLAGGLELAMACDLALAVEDARLGDQHATFGLTPGSGGSVRLPRFIGIRKAKELLLTGSNISGSEAESLRLVNRAVPPNKLEEAVAEIAENLTERSPLASKEIKSLVNQGMQVDIYTALQLERGAYLRHLTSEDTQEGQRAFKEKRKPIFKGR